MTETIITSTLLVAVAASTMAMGRASKLNPNGVLFIKYGRGE